MKLTKNLKTEILKAYHEYWNAYLKGDMQTMSYWMHENIQMVGSGRGEFFKNKKETIGYYKSTVGQVAGKADMRNRKISVAMIGEQVMVNEQCDFFVLIDGVWTFYEQGRISTLFTKTNKGWKIIQEHGSMPDARTNEGEQVNTNKIKAENVRLKNAVKRRTIELENKNRELEAAWQGAAPAGAGRYQGSNWMRNSRCFS
ncbi:MAG: nuclear transport factor 2 family protein [Chitinophagaceae bacterium]